MRLPWPEIASEQRPDETIRQILDYIAWIAREMRTFGFHGPEEGDRWRRRVHRAYQALFLPPLPGHGDPYPPDVPPPERPGVWPDVPAVVIPGMTVRHQLKVIGMLAEELRDRVWRHARPPVVVEWDRRLVLAREALDHGTTPAMPDEAKTEPSPDAIREAEAQERAVAEHARRRAQRLERLRSEAQSRGRARAAAASPRPQVAAPAASGPVPSPANERRHTKGAAGASTAKKAGRKKSKSKSKSKAKAKKPTTRTSAQKGAARKKAPSPAKAARKTTRTSRAAKSSPRKKAQAQAKGAAKPAARRSPRKK